MTFALEFRGLQRPPLDEYFQYDIDHLPASYNADHYGRFVKYWGTHYFTVLLNLASCFLSRCELGPF